MLLPRFGPIPIARGCVSATSSRRPPLHYSGDMAPNDPQNRAFFVACNDLHGRIASWLAMNGKDLVDLNERLLKGGLKAIVLAKASELVMPVCAPSGSK